MTTSAPEQILVPPTGADAPSGRTVDLAAGVTDFRGKTIVAMRHLFRADETFPILERLFRERFGDVTWISNHDVPDERVASRADEEALGAFLHERGADLLIAGNANCGTCAPAVSRAVVAAEKAGIPAVGIVVDDFVRSAKATAKGAGLADARIAVYPGSVAIDPDDELERKFRDVMFPQIVELMERRSTVHAPEGAPHERTVTVSGDDAAVSEAFLDRGWTDGLPIVPPTPERVARFLEHTARGPRDVVARLLPSRRAVTVESIAVNGVMAGCRPEYMPVLVAMVEVLADPRFHQEDAGSSAGWTPLIVLNGPVADELGFNHSTGVLRHGSRPNSTVSRALRMILRNVAGFLPGVGDMATYGRPDVPVLVEDESRSPWEPLSVARGFAPGESVVTLTSLGAMGFHLTAVAQDADDLLRNITTKVRLALLAGDGSAITKGLELSHFLVLSPVLAQTLADAGYDRVAVQEYVYEHAKVPARKFDEWLGLQGIPSATECVARGLLQPHFAESADPERLVPVYHFAHELQIVVSGTPNRNRFFVGMNIARQGLATSKRVEPTPVREG